MVKLKVGRNIIEQNSTDNRFVRKVHQQKQK